MKRRWGHGAKRIWARGSAKGSTCDPGVRVVREIGAGPGEQPAWVLTAVILNADPHGVVRGNRSPSGVAIAATPKNVK